MKKDIEKQVELELRQLRIKMRMRNLIKHLFSNDNNSEIENYRYGIYFLDETNSF